MILMVVREILKFISGMYWRMKPRKLVAYGRNSIFLSAISAEWSWLSMASIELVLSYNVVNNLILPSIGCFRLKRL